MRNIQVHQRENGCLVVGLRFPIFFFFLYGVKAHEIVFKEKVNNEKEISCFKKHEYSFYSSKPL